MTIHIESLTFETIIGLLDFEREKPQRVIVSLRATYDYADNFLDYATIVDMIQNNFKKNRYKLLEEALLGIKNELFDTYPDIEKLYLKVSKPDIIAECTVALSHEW